jgi:dihydrolipoamide dehydrogenase
MTTKITVIGAGPGGYVAAIRAAQLGAEVTLIERENVGGTCLNWGCIPSKIMKTTADLLEDFKQAPALGVRLSGNAVPDMVTLNLRKKTIIQSQAQGIHKLIKQNRIDYIKGAARISGKGRLTVSSAEEKAKNISWDRLIIATGSSPFSPDAFPFDHRRIISSSDALMLQEVPESILILGGGVIGCEFASIFAAFGARVTLVEGLSRLLPLPGIDESCSKVLQREMKKRKIKILLKHTATAADIDSETVRITLGPSRFDKTVQNKMGEPQTIEVEKMLVCIGRQPNTDDMGLEQLGISRDHGGWLIVDDGMATNVEGVFAVGDVLGPPKIMLAHVASTEGIIAAENAMGMSRKMDYRVVPSTIFTQPEVANVGLSEIQAREQGGAVRSDSILFRALGKAQVMGKIAGETKIVSSEKDGKIIGVHIIGPHAADLIAEGALAMQQGATVSDLAGTIHAHPTLAEAMLEGAHKALGHPIHG